MFFHELKLFTKKASVEVVNQEFQKMLNEYKT